MKESFQFGQGLAIDTELWLRPGFELTDGEEKHLHARKGSYNGMIYFLVTLLELWSMDLFESGD